MVDNNNENKTGFTISKDDQKKIDDWYGKIIPEIIKRQSEELELELPETSRENARPYYGTIGGGLEYCFIPTGLGTIVKVKEAITGMELDITDYCKW